MIADQILSRLEFLHMKGFVHRDLKANNFMIGNSDKKNIIYIIDFGLAKRFTDPKTGAHIIQKFNKSVMGTLRFCSLNATKGNESSRRDDIEGLGFMLAYLLRGGNLPWMGIRGGTNTERFKKISHIKESTSFDSLFDGFSDEFVNFMHVARALLFEQKPNYDQLRSFFHNIIRFSIREKNEFMFDWLLKR